MCVFWFVLSVLLVAVLVHSSEDCSKSGSDSYDLDTQTLTIWCGGLFLDSYSLNNSFINASPSEVKVESCKAYDANIADILKEKNITLPRSLRITDILDMDILQPKIYSELRNIFGLYICQNSPTVFETVIKSIEYRVPVSFIETFPSLQTLHLTGLALPSNFNSSISELSLENMEIDQSIHCRTLRTLTLRSVRVYTNFVYNIFEKYSIFVEPWLTNNIDLEKVTIENVKEGFFAIFFLLKRTESINSLTISHCEIKQIWSEYNQLVHVFHRLVEPWNKTPFDILNYCGGQELENINPFQHFLPKYLKKLSLAHNRLSSLCYQDSHKKSDSEKKENIAEEMCIRLHGAVNLLNLSHNLFTEVAFQDILKIGSQNIEIDLRGNPLEFIHFEDEEYTALAKQIQQDGANITILLDSLINCKCHHGWLARAIRDFPSFVVTARCQDEVKTRLEEAPKERLECTEISCYPGCSCRRQWRGNVTTLRCKGLTSMPNVPNLHALLASSNQIAELRSENLPDTLKILDLSNNTLSLVDATVAAKLFSVSKRRVWLAGNPFLCACQTKHFFKALKDNKAQVLDYDKIKCYNQTGILQPLTEISVDGLCADLPETDIKSTIIMALSVIFALSAVLAIFVALYYRHKRSIKQYLYLRGCYLFCVTEGNDEEDSEMLYDVFLSYSHKDEQFILQELLPGLEDDQMHPYKVCVHFRDWIVGEFIPKQILESVEQSRRTLIVLSRNFVQSIWGLLEFRSALMSYVYENRSRLIVVVLDDVVNDSNLEPEIRNYVRTNTYVRWSDPQFWEKLRYALPHRTRKVKKSKFSSKRNRMCNNVSIMLTNFVESNVSNLVYPNDYIQ